MCVFLGTRPLHTHTPGVLRLGLWSRLFLGSDYPSANQSRGQGAGQPTVQREEGLRRGLAGQGRGLGASKGSGAATGESWRWDYSAQGTGLRGQE